MNENVFISVRSFKVKSPTENISSTRKEPNRKGIG